MRKRWRMKSKCSNCPFHETGPGRNLRETLRKSRWEDILFAVFFGGEFLCHQTTKETGNGTNLQCAGALEYQKSAWEKPSVLKWITKKLQRVCRESE